MDLTINEIYDKYLSYVTLKCKPQSIRSIKSRFKNYILPHIGDIKLKDLTALKYLEWQTTIENMGFSFKYKKALHYTMVSLFNFCITFLDVQINVPSKVGNFKNKEETKKVSYWNYEEFSKFIKQVNEPIYKTLYTFLYFTGCRLGECLALTFDDIENNIIKINKTISKEYINGNRAITSPKTKKSIRNIHIDNYLLNEINNLKQNYSTNSEIINNYFVFGGKKPLSPTTIERKKNKYCDLAEVKRIRLHDFRHSHATLLINHNVPINEISARLGHSNINTTIETYIHASLNNEKRALDILNSLRLN